MAAYEKYKAEFLGVKDYFARANAEERQVNEREYKLMELKRYEAEAEKTGHVFLQILKSNLLWRLLYCGEELRPTRCPEHKGKWSGIEGPDYQCPHKCHLTGWIRKEDTPVPDPV